MGKKRIIKKSEPQSGKSGESLVTSRLPKRKITGGTFYIQSTYNNTIMSLADGEKGDIVLWASAGALGFSGARKGTPYAATKVAEFIGERAKMVGLQSASIVVKGIGAGRESAIRSLAAQGFILKSIRDATPIPHNGPKPPKPRRV